MDLDPDHAAALLGYVTSAASALSGADHAHASRLAEVAEGLWHAGDPEIALRALELSLALRARVPARTA